MLILSFDGGVAPADNRFCGISLQGDSFTVFILQAVSFSDMLSFISVLTAAGTATKVDNTAVTFLSCASPIRSCFVIQQRFLMNRLNLSRLKCQHSVSNAVDARVHPHSTYASRELDLEDFAYVWCANKGFKICFFAYG